MRSTPSLPSFPGSLSPGEVKLDWVLSKGQIELFDVLTECRIELFDHLTVCKQMTDV